MAGDTAYNLDYSAQLIDDMPIAQPTQSTTSLFRESAVLALYALLYAALTFPAVSYIQSAFFGGARGDAGIYVWLVENNAKEVLTWPTKGFDVSFFYPFGRALAYTDNFLFPSLITKTLVNFGLNLAAAYNSLFLLSAVLNGYLTYLLCAEVTKRHLSAFLSGIAFMCSPFLFSHLGHPQLQFAFFLPLALLGSIWFANGYTSRGTLIGLAVVGAFLSAVYYALFAILLSALTFLGFLLLRPAQLTFRRIAELFAVNSPWIFFLYLFAKPYMQVHEAFGPRRLLELRPFSASLLSYLSAPPGNVLWGALTSGLSNYETYLFPGTFILLGAGLAVGQAWRGFNAEVCARNGKAFKMFRHLPWLAIVSVIALVASHLPFAILENPRIQSLLITLPFWMLLIFHVAVLFFLGRWSQGVGPLSRNEAALLFSFLCLFFLFASFGLVGETTSRQAAGEPGTFFPSLSLVLYRYVPGFDSLRATGRIGVVTNLSLMVLAAIGLATILELYGRTKLVTAGLFGTCLVWTAFELRVKDFPLAGEERESLAYLHLATLPGNEAAINLPFGFIGDGGTRFALMQTDYMRWLQATGRPMVNGYSGKMPQFQEYLDLKTRNFPDPQSFRALGRIIGLRYIFFSPRHQSNFDAKKFEQEIAQYPESLKLILKDPQGNYLFDFQPTLPFEETELYAPPNQHSMRNLSFQVRLESPAVDSSTANLQVEMPPAEQPVVVTLPGTADWTSVSMSIPASTDPVVPQKARLRLLDQEPGKKFVIRAIKLN